MSLPVISVIVPTHERAQYAVPTIRSMLAQEDGIEVVVCDTSEEDRISTELGDCIHLPRLKLVRPGKNLNMVDNFNAALAVATGKYLTFIGDDDFVSDQIVTVAKWAEAQEIDAITFSFPTLYFWPDFRHKTQDDSIAGTLRTSSFTGKVIPHDSKAAALQALANFGGGVMRMPRVYAGLVSRDLVKRVQEKHGPLFGSISPDIYSAFLVSQEARNCVYIDYPVIVPGASGASASGQSANKKHVGPLRDSAHIRSFPDFVWDERIPDFYCVPTVWSHSLLRAVEKHGVLTKKINFFSLYLKCIIFHRRFLRETLQAAIIYTEQNSLGSILWSAVTAILSEATWVVKKIGGRLLYKVKIKKNHQVISNLANTMAAKEAFQIYSSSNKAKLELP